MSVDAKFNTAVEDVRKLKAKPSDDDLLELYALFKQATVGDVNTSRPGMLDLKGKAKWDAWSKKKGTNSEAAKEQYISKVTSLIESIGLQ
ncbi:putative acyl-CoA-binding protein [Coccinella septempunctata]|uniref:putative acyl-CoA-binding protein n=1 Tax=Coccinella septempunctata TaxID=41139 RepID=UPI001D0970E1|nr:putative acyl-CoA-binding protein [Coccinella septempunctata]